MPVHKTPGGYKWGTVGKTYPAKAQAQKQAAAIYASGYRQDYIPGVQSLPPSKVSRPDDDRTSQPAARPVENKVKRPDVGEGY
jgi:hypothetical protein